MGGFAVHVVCMSTQSEGSALEAESRRGTSWEGSRGRKPQSRWWDHATWRDERGNVVGVTLLSREMRMQIVRLLERHDIAMTIRNGMVDAAMDDFLTTSTDSDWHESGAAVQDRIRDLLTATESEIVESTRLMVALRATEVGERAVRNGVPA